MTYNNLPSYTYTIYTIDELENLVIFADEVLSEKDIPLEINSIIHLVIDEIALNVVEHGFSNVPTKNGLLTTIVFNPNEIVLSFEDDGIPFNPIQHNVDLQMDKPLLDHNLGGLGIHIVRHYADDIEYEYVNGKNILVFHKRW
ncbi:MAG: ATP-binding protein [Ignavibacteria bacterium]|nr:ATP-binding protein [Ignavibacteria bacterium]